MKILIINAGSSTIKFEVFDADEADMHMIINGEISKIGEASGGSIAYTLHNGEKHEQKKEAKDHAEAFSHILKLLTDPNHNILKDYKKDLLLIGHRVVHGGEEFLKPVVIDEPVLQAIENLGQLAPLHNPINAKGIRESMKVFEHVPQVAAFDTSFHVRSLPPIAYRYALPPMASKKVRRYGFHGTSHEFVSRRAAKLAMKNLEESNLITLHLGNGCSACAIRNGKSIDTSMGLTPLEGLVMGSRSGDLDPAIVTHLMTNAGETMDPFQTEKLLNRESGLKGLCGSNDMREVIKKMNSGDENAKLAFDLFCYRIQKYVGSYFVALNGCDALVFTAGIGEHSHEVRSCVCSGLHSLGIFMDEEANQKVTKENEETWVIHAPNSKVKIFVIPTNEELEIAKQSLHALKEHQGQK